MKYNTYGYLLTKEYVQNKFNEIIIDKNKKEHW